MIEEAVLLQKCWCSGKLGFSSRTLKEFPSCQEIVTALVVAPGTVKLHVSHILSKLGVNSRTRAILRVHDLGLLPDEYTASS